MATSEPNLRKTRRKIEIIVLPLNALGAFLSFLYFRLIDPLPSNNESLQQFSLFDLVPFVIVMIITFAIGNIWARGINQRIETWYEALKSGVPASDVPERVRADVLNVATYVTRQSAAMWLLGGIIFAWLFQSIRVFIGIVGIGGLFTVALVYFVSDLLWRPMIPFFFPEGDVSSIKAFRLTVLGRLLVVFLLVGLFPPILLVGTTISRVQDMLNSGNPQAILDNLVFLQLFILAISLAASVGLAIFFTRSITKSINDMQGAMDRVAQNDFDVQIPVSSNDELGYLGEHFNSMVAGLKRGEQLNRLFGLYVSPEVARAAVESGAGLGGELAHCTVLFSDLRGFTTLTEEMSPEALVALINRYMTVMVSIVAEYGGIITRFGGDSILAVFGSPLNKLKNDAAQSVQAALAMRRALRTFNDDEGMRGDRALEMGIGIATGPVIAGNVGGKERIEYTVMGDAANLASRLQNLTKDIGSPILLSEETYRQAVSDVAVKANQVPAVSIRGKKEAVTIYGLDETQIGRG